MALTKEEYEVLLQINGNTPLVNSATNSRIMACLKSVGLLAEGPTGGYILTEDGARALKYGYTETINHPAHYGGAEDPYEAIKVIEAWGLGFHDGNAVKYIRRAGKKGSRLEDLKKARWYLDREIERMESK